MFVSNANVVWLNGCNFAQLIVTLYSSPNGSGGDKGETGVPPPSLRWDTLFRSHADVHANIIYVQLIKLAKKISSSKNSLSSFPLGGVELVRSPIQLLTGPDVA